MISNEGEGYTATRFPIQAIEPNLEFAVATVR